MKKLFIFSLLIIFVLSIGAFAGTKWKNALKPVGKSVTIKVVKDSVPTYKIVVPEKACLNVFFEDLDVYKHLNEKVANHELSKYIEENPDANNLNKYLNEIIASQDLAKYLGQIYGVKFEIVKDTEFKGGNFISIGNTKQFQESGIKLSEFKSDAFSIDIDNNKNIYFNGGYNTGVLNGVYSFLTDDLGCRFYTILHDDVIPKNDKGFLVFVPRAETPCFNNFRFVGNPEYSENRSYPSLVTKNRPYVRKNKFHSWEPNGGCHTVNIFCPFDNFKDHPEWFSMVNGKRETKQLCWSNKEMLKVLINNALNEMRTYKKDTICISNMDSYPCCDCPECNAFDKAHGSKSASVINAMNELAKAVKAEFPNGKVQTLAYLDTVNPPTDLPLEDNLGIVLCSDRCDWDYPLCHYGETQPFQQNVKDWVKICKNVMIWMYVQNYDHLLIPNPNNLVVAENLKLLKEWGVQGVYLQGIGWNHEFISNDGYFRTWLWGQLLWNPDRSVEELTKDYCYGYYGDKIGELMLQYEMSLIDMYKTAHAMPHDPSITSDLKTEAGLPMFEALARDNKGVVFTNGIRWTPDVQMYTEEWISNSEKLFEKALSLCKTQEEKDKVLYTKLSLNYLILARHLGYLKIGGSFVSKPFVTDPALKAKLEKIYAEYTYVMDKQGVKAIGEIGDHLTSRARLDKKWKQALTINMEGIGLQKLDPDKWFFQIDPNNVGESEGWYKPSYDVSNWEKISIGKVWDDFGHPKYVGSGWYQTKTFNISKDHLGAQGFYLLCPGADEEATVYVNGQLVYEHTMAVTGLDNNQIYITPFVANIKPFLVEGENDIRIKVTNVAGAGGLDRPISLCWTYKNVSEEDLMALAQ